LKKVVWLLSGKVKTKVAAVQIKWGFWKDKSDQVNEIILCVQDFLDEFLGQHGNVKNAFTIPIRVPVDQVSKNNEANIKVLLYLLDDCLKSGYHPRLKEALGRRLRKLPDVKLVIEFVKKSSW
jgi:hypothetical protein